MTRCIYFATVAVANKTEKKILSIGHYIRYCKAGSNKWMTLIERSTPILIICHEHERENEILRIVNAAFLIFIYSIYINTIYSVSSRLLVCFVSLL